MNTSKIVIVYGSPRDNGNSSTLGKAIMEGAMGLSLNTITIHKLNTLHYTKGCQYCDKCKDSDFCCVDDDILEVLKDIRDCDALVICFPLFFNGPCSQLKILIDRMYSFLDKNMVPRYPGKKLIMVMTYDEKESEHTVDLVKKQMTAVFTENFGFKAEGFISYKCEHKLNTVINDKATLNAARKIGESLSKVKTDLC